MARSLSVALIGGMRMGGRIRMNENLTRISVIGGLNLDLSQAEFAPSGKLFILKISLIGGLSLRVPPGTRVKVRSFAISGTDIEAGVGDGAGPPTVTIWSFGFLGGVRVRRAGVARKV